MSGFSAVEVGRIDEAIRKAQQFLRRARECKIRIGEAAYSVAPMKERAAMRRASMDLTRALAILRGRAS